MVRRTPNNVGEIGRQQREQRETDGRVEPAIDVDGDVLQSIDANNDGERVLGAVREACAKPEATSATERLIRRLKLRVMTVDLEALDRAAENVTRCTQRCDHIRHLLRLLQIDERVHRSEPIQIDGRCRAGTILGMPKLVSKRCDDRDDSTRSGPVEDGPGESEEELRHLEWRDRLAAALRMDRVERELRLLVVSAGGVLPGADGAWLWTPGPRAAARR